MKPVENNYVRGYEKFTRTKLSAAQFIIYGKQAINYDKAGN